MTVPAFIPPREEQLVVWSENFRTLITATPTAFGLTAAQATAYGTLDSAFATAMTRVSNPSTNSDSAVQAKNTAKQNLLYGPGGGRELVDIVQAYPGTTDEMRAQLNIKIKDADPRPIPAPEVAPDLSIVQTIGRSVKIRLRDADNPDSRAKPAGVKGATVLTFIGEESPTDPLGWAYCTTATRTLFDVDFPGSVPIGTKVWITAMWFNGRGEQSPAAAPAWTCLADGLGQALAA
jgi:hypothetical protein